MKKISVLIIMAAIIAAGCNQKVETESVDLNAVNDTITQLADKYFNAWNAGDIDLLIELVADDGLFFGSDPSEILDKKSLKDMYTELFSDTTTDLSYDIDLRKTKLAADGKSAFVVEYFTMDHWSPMIPLRQTSHMVKSNNTWKIDFIAWGLIAKNQDIEKLNKALE